MRNQLPGARIWALALLACPFLFGTPCSGQSQDQANPPSSQAPDNSARNRSQAKTADNQNQNASDREITQRIRRSIVADKSLSTYAHNVKIITQDGQVTLKGPVRTDDERKSIASKAAEVVGEGKVTNQLSVKQ